MYEEHGRAQPGVSSYDDFVIGFEHEADARRVMDVLPKRVGNYGLTLHPDKTRLFPFRRPPAGQKGGKGPATFDFLGFTFYWARNRKGRWGMLCKTRSASLRRIIGSVYDWCRRHRHSSVKEQHAALKRRIQGHFNYFGVSGNFRSLLRVTEQAKRIGYKWLCRRSQRKRLTRERFADLLRDFPLRMPKQNRIPQLRQEARLRGHVERHQGPALDPRHRRGERSKVRRISFGIELKESTQRMLKLT